MKDFEQITDIYDLVGKTIANCVHDERGNICLSFTDYTIAVFESFDSGREVEICDDQYIQFPNKYNYETYYELGIINYNERESIFQSVLKEESQQKQLNELNEIETLKTLQLKYPNIKP